MPVLKIRLNGEWVDIAGAGVSQNDLQEYVDEAISSIPTPDVSGQIDAHNSDTSAHEDIRTYINESLASFSSCPYIVGTTTPDNTSLLWIDTNAGTGGLKYYNGTEWVHVPVAYT